MILFVVRNIPFTPVCSFQQSLPSGKPLHPVCPFPVGPRFAGTPGTSTVQIFPRPHLHIAPGFHTLKPIALAPVIILVKVTRAETVIVLDTDFQAVSWVLHPDPQRICFVSTRHEFSFHRTTYGSLRTSRYGSKSAGIAVTLTSLLKCLTYAQDFSPGSQPGADTSSQHSIICQQLLAFR